MLFSRFVDEIKKNILLKSGDTVVVAVSGGADSVCLLHLFYRLRQQTDIKLVCAHVNHMLRPEADSDAAFVESLCNKWEIPFMMHKEDVGAVAKSKKSSVELVGREVRYRFFKSIPADVIATAHNKNDVAETVLLHMTRGCGMRGLCGIYAKRDDDIIRPLLQFERHEIEAYLEKHGLVWREDKTNNDIHYARNYIRHEILPKMNTLNPSFSDTVLRMTEILQEEEAYLNAQADALDAVHAEDDVYFVSIDKLQGAPSALRRRIIFSIINSYDAVNRIIALLSQKNGTTIELPGNMEAVREYNEIAIYKKNNDEIPSLMLPNEGSVEFGPYTVFVGQGGFKLKKNTYMIRARKTGDVFFPEGMNGRKKVKEYFIDKKIPKRIRDTLPIFVSGEDIASLADMRRDRRFVPSKDEPYIEICIKKSKK